jgi:hypothetical protein
MTIISPATKQNKGKSHCVQGIRRRKGLRIQEEDIIGNRENEDECLKGE